ncbi:hypothetical protein O7626_40870 [Micromonospora sp. WMMD1102]|nr:hypothetical protein [Micromonospora sp. WMMD1102]MDG4790355.1 hypothetical protein [Micromonospora sp. WMMD1102]MDG4792158.1 hypothetical protein [Micromonospora sp. WMMD1102]
MTRPRRHTPEQAAEAQRIVDESRLTTELVGIVRDQPGRLIRNPCGDPDGCQHGHCYGTPAEAEQVRRTGLPADDGRE